MTRALEAYREGNHVGRFAQNAGGTTTFTYDEDAPKTPISLSLPRDGGSMKRAPANFLENFLPDNASTRARMAASYGAVSVNAFDLLAKAGGDIAGGLVLLPEGQALQSTIPVLDPALTGDIAARIAAIKRDPDSWTDELSPARFSLAGTQGKFALARIEDDWYWSNETVPSTHILKPANPKLVGLEAAEAAALTLAADIGIAAPHATTLEARDQTSFIVERFDRTSDGQIARRLHAEDLAQSLGRSPTEKYGVTAAQVIGLLNQVDPSADLAYAFVRQLAFNVVIGNADAHAKNYSVLLRPGGVELAPLYDAVPMVLYPEFDQHMAMKIGGAQFARQGSRTHWRKLAEKTGLDPDRTVAVAIQVAEAAAERAGSAWAGLEDGHGLAMEQAVLQITADFTRTTTG